MPKAKVKSATRASTKANEIVVAIDYGTTFSGAAYTYKSRPHSADQIPVIRGYEGGRNADKAPSCLRYEALSLDDQPLIERKRKAAEMDLCDSKTPTVVEWGFAVDRDQEYLQLIKLLLDQHQDWPPFVSRDEIEARLNNMGKTPVEAAADYLVKLKIHIFETLKRQIGETMLSTTKFKFVLTVPALWSDTAKNATLQAAEKAGLGDSQSFSMVTEPEAAAMYALNQMEGLDLRRGDNYIVCDAGGGTVDLISYEVVSVSPMRLQESAPGSGGICGSGLLNLKLEEHVHSLMGAGATTFRKYKAANPRAWNSCMSLFESQTKRDFDPGTSPNKTHYLPLVGAENDRFARISNNYIAMSTADLNTIFDPIINRVAKLVQDQYSSLSSIGKFPKGLILVGGFGESIHLYRSLKDQFKDIEGFSILQPPQAWSAVARGAVIHSIEGERIIQSRVARRHYGVVMRQHWDPAKHSLGNKLLDEDDEREYADNQIEWYVTKGQVLSSDESIVMPFHFTKSGNDFDDIITLVVSEEPEPPKEFDNTPLTRILCTIKPQTLRIPANKWRKEMTMTGKRYSLLDYKVGMKFGASGIFFDMQVGNSVYGSATAEYE